MYSRLNYFRFILALSVLLFHIYNPWFPLAGPLAVLGFFFVSGFLVSEMLATTYAGRPRDFLVNRFLRIFPAYWASLLLGVLLLLVIPQELAATNRMVVMPNNVFDILHNLIIFGVQDQHARIIAPSWSLDIELRWYLILFVLSFFSIAFRKIALLLLGLIVVFFIVPVNTQFYGNMWGSGFAFSAGALFYYYRPQFPVGVQWCGMLALYLIMFVVPLYVGEGRPVQRLLDGWYLQLGFIAALYIAFGLLLARGRYSAWSQWFGSLSYPLFMTHFLASALVYAWIGEGKGTLANLAGTLVVTLLISWAIVQFVENPIARYRKQVRERSVS